jgi:hypothetical protein
MRRSEIEIVEDTGREDAQAGIRRPSRQHSSEVPARTTQTASAHTPPLPLSLPGASLWSTTPAGWEAAAADSARAAACSGVSCAKVWMVPAEPAAVSPRARRTSSSSSLPAAASALAFGISSSEQRQVSRPATMPTASGEQARSDTALSSTVSSSSTSSVAATTDSESLRARLLLWLRAVPWLLLTFPRRGAGHLLAVPHCGLPPRTSLLLLLLLLLLLVLE